MAQETPQLVAERREAEAVASARQRLERQRTVVGEHHPEYATGLNQLALLMIVQGDLAGAEPLLRQALAIRKDVLGERHPDFATNLSSLAGLLWARGDLEESEPLLRQALEIRRAVLGPTHPKTLASQTSLEQLNRARTDRLVLSSTTAPAAPKDEESLPPPQPVSEPEPSAPTASMMAEQGADATDGQGRVEPAAPVPAARDDALTTAALTERHDTLSGEFGRLSDRTSEAVDKRWQPMISRSLLMSQSNSMDLSQELATLSEAFSSLGERLLHAARLLHSPGTPPPEDLLEELTARRRDFLGLRDRARHEAEALDVACPPDEALDGLQSLTSLLDDVAEAEIRQSKSEEVRRRSLAVLDRVLSLSHATIPEFPALHDCQEQARQLRAAIADGRWTEMPAEADRLTEGEHPFVSLLTLIEDGEELHDDHWATLHEAVGASFGKPLAAAAARAKLVLPADSTSEDSSSSSRPRRGAARLKPTGS